MFALSSAAKATTLSFLAAASALAAATSAAAAAIASCSARWGVSASGITRAVGITGAVGITRATEAGGEAPSCATWATRKAPSGTGAPGIDLGNLAGDLGALVSPLNSASLER